jgi:hypothetical protein
VNEMKRSAETIISLNLLQRIAKLEREFKTMANELADLQAAVVTLGTAVGAASAEMSKLSADLLAALKASPTGVDPAAVETSATAINTLAKQLNEAVTAANAAATPAP